MLLTNFSASESEALKRTNFSTDYSTELMKFQQFYSVILMKRIQLLLGKYKNVVMKLEIIKLLYVGSNQNSFYHFFIIRWPKITAHINQLEWTSFCKFHKVFVKHCCHIKENQLVGCSELLTFFRSRSNIFYFLFLDRHI